MYKIWYYNKFCSNRIEWKLCNRRRFESVYDDIIKKENGNTISFSEVLDEYMQTADMMVSIDFNGISYFSYLRHLKSIMFTSKEKDNNFFMCFVRDNISNPTYLMEIYK